MIGAFKVPRSNSASLQKIKNAVISFLLKTGVIEKSYCLIEETERVPDSHTISINMDKLSEELQGLAHQLQYLFNTQIESIVIGREVYSRIAYNISKEASAPFSFIAPRGIRMVGSRLSYPIRIIVLPWKEGITVVPKTGEVYEWHP